MRVFVGLPWPEHVAFLDDHALRQQIRRDVTEQVGRLSSHPAALLFALGNEIPASIVRWHGKDRIEQFVRELYEEAKTVAPQSLFTYVNFPPTEYLELPFLDVCAFNVYLHREDDLRRYLARLQHIAGHRPLLLAEAGADSIREGEEGQAALTAMQIRASFAEGACGAIAFAWTDEWWRGGHTVEDWAFGLVDSERRFKPALAEVAAAFEDAPFPASERPEQPKVSVVVCAYNAADTIAECLSSIGQLDYPDFEVILVNDGSRDATLEIARGFPGIRIIDIPNGGLSAARNIGLREAHGEIVAYPDADVRVDPSWLTYLVRPFLESDVVGCGGPNVVPPDDPWLAQCVARAPGGPTHVMVDDRTAEHIPGCNMAFRRDALRAIGGFNAVYVHAGDDVDICWRLQAQGWRLGFAPSALVWHHHRNTIRAYWRQQAGYGEAEAMLRPRHPDKFPGLHIGWGGRIYGAIPFLHALSPARINTGVWGTEPFPSVYRMDAYPFAFLPHSARWQLLALIPIVVGTVTSLVLNWTLGMPILLGGLVALGVTGVRCVKYALATDIEPLLLTSKSGSIWKGLAYHASLTWLHFLQPLARGWGRLKGELSTYQSEIASEDTQRAGFQLGPVGLSRIPRISSFRTTEQTFWSETWISAEAVLVSLAAKLRPKSAIQILEIDDGWQSDYDIRVVVDD